jgi:hypothetical protein
MKRKSGLRVERETGVVLPVQYYRHKKCAICSKFPSITSEPEADSIEEELPILLKINI